MTSKDINTNKAPKPVGLYPHARRVGDLLFLSGIGPRIAGSGNGDSQVPGLEMDKSGNFETFNFEAQVHAVLKNVKAVLEAAGSSWENLIDITVFLVDIKRDFKILNRVYAEYVQDMDPKPCRTTVEVRALPTPIAIELKCIATIEA